jgi:glycerol-3-phosphate dehydrogenase
VRDEMALTLADVVWRRTDLGSAGLPDDAELRDVALLMARELGWDDERIRKEIEGVKARRPQYRPLQSTRLGITLCSSKIPTT